MIETKNPQSQFSPAYSTYSRSDYGLLSITRPENPETVAQQIKESLISISSSLIRFQKAVGKGILDPRIRTITENG